MKQDREICLAAGMDDYLSKPLDPDQLLDLLEQQRAVGDAEIRDGQAGQCTAVFDLESALQRARGKHTLLKQLARVFLQDLPASMSELPAATKAGDAQKMRRIAHRLRGAAKTLSADSVADKAAELEVLSMNQQLDVAREVVAELQLRVNDLAGELAAYVGA